MARPLLVTDCDEVLLHMVVPFAEWVDEVHDLHFDLDSGHFVDALRHKLTGETVSGERIWSLLKGFFTSEMHRQGEIIGAVKAINALSEHADIAVLTNLTDNFREARADQLRAVGIDFPVFCNQGPKGEPLAKIVASYDPSVAVFIDDLGQHHHSAAEHVPGVFRLHMVGEPRMARSVEPAEAAHARIDDWQSAHDWIMDRFQGVPL